MSPRKANPNNNDTRTTTVTLSTHKRLESKQSVLAEEFNDSICWWNKDKVDHEIVFAGSDWPFNGAMRRIQVPANKKSEVLTVQTGAIKKTYSYSVDPPIVYDANAPAGGPDGPAVIVNGD